MKIKEEYGLANTWDELIEFDRKYCGIRRDPPDIDAICVDLEKKAPLKLRRWMRQSYNEKSRNFRHQNKS